MSFQSLVLALPLLAGAASAATCYSGVNLFQTRGTGEAPLGSLSDVAANATVDAIPDSHLTRVPYPANFTWKVSVSEGISLLHDMTTQYVQDCPDSKIALLGYSQGASVAGYALTGSEYNATALSQDVTSKIVAIVLYGDPGRQANQDYDHGECTKDSGGVRKDDQAKTFNSFGDVIASYCNAEDPVCCGDGDDVTQHVSYFTQENGKEVADFVKQKFEAAGGSSGGAAGGSTGGSSASSSSTPTATLAQVSQSPKSSAKPTSTKPATTSSAARGGAGAGTPASSTQSESPTFTGSADKMSAAKYGSALSGLALFAFML